MSYFAVLNLHCCELFAFNLFAFRELKFIMYICAEKHYGGIIFIMNSFQPEIYIKNPLRNQITSKQNKQNEF